MPLQVGDMVGAYEIVGTLGQGGMATVYQAHHKRLDRFVALKLMHESFLQDDDFRARFQREARIVARLEHPHIVPIYDFADHDGVPYLVMKFVQGMTLKRYAIKYGLTLNETYSMLMPIAQALDFAHQQGVLHRDIKPSNILIDQSDKAYITDFGLARIVEAGTSTISHDMMLGTPYYISPEQAQGDKDLDSRTDIYSLGVILYELVSGRVPFKADTPYAIVHQHVYQQPESPSTHNNQLPPAVDDVLHRALAKDPADRYDTAQKMMDAFKIAIADSVAQNTPPPQQTADFDQAPAAPPAQNNNAPKRPPERSQPPVDGVPSAAPRRQVEAELDLGNIDFNNLGNSIRTGMTSFAEMIEERIDTELRNRRGMPLTEEERIRRRVAKKMEARNEFVQHLAVYLSVNTMLIFIWAFTSGGFFWPMFPIFFWGMGVAGQGYEYYSKYGPGAERREEEIEQEVQRQLGRNNRQEKRKADKPKRDRLSIDDLQGGGVRLNEDGELSDSFIEEQQGGQR